jgi:hypothetical protein
MQAYSLIVDPKLIYDDLQTPDTKLKLAPGWTYRLKVLDADLENTYDACFEETGQKACSIMP